MSMLALSRLVNEGLLLLVPVKVGTQGRIEVLCVPRNCRNRYGTEELQVTPVKGTGAFWTSTYREADADAYEAA